MRSIFLAAILALTPVACTDQSGTPSTMPPPLHSEGTAALSSATSAPLVDQVKVGDDASEAAHAQKGDNTENGVHMDRSYRHSQGGWFSWDLKVIPNQPNSLVLTYWGGDVRNFNILVDGQLLVAENINNDHPEEFFDKTYTLPPQMTKDRQKVTVRFQSPAEGYAGGVFGIKIMRPSAATIPAK